MHCSCSDCGQAGRATPPAADPRTHAATCANCQLARAARIYLAAIEESVRAIREYLDGSEPPPPLTLPLDRLPVGCDQDGHHAADRFPHLG